MTEDEALKERQRLANEAVQKVQRAGVESCPMCKKNAGWNAEVVGVLVTMIPLTEGFPLPPPFFPSLALTCRSCAYVSFHNLKALGIVK